MIQYINFFAKIPRGGGTLLYQS